MITEARSSMSDSEPTSRNRTVPSGNRRDRESRQDRHVENKVAAQNAEFDGANSERSHFCAVDASRSRKMTCDIGARKRRKIAGPSAPGGGGERGSGDTIPKTGMTGKPKTSSRR